ncbi:DUF4229 domain-containing protein [Paractinoplanes brasiliensis]|uniref:Uncharacterized protein DUF4229 n=1 Tax=Paractinoplanes brasiliensis TaxID=52695 RepID=A0A4R6JRN4_9ACTN|nr:DUF4229 domain-containing protein [Actinoplanes brasiliensis]TDO39244.1 uncharacterized protein DUF4229 [Actinoplanes brasiliensis]GID30054.1 hypothetical protein Abr02nite_50370 [Actinoplanes brasiliensis]
MSPAIKYTLGRVGLFAVVLGLLSFFPLNLLVAGMIAIVVSAVASYFLLAKWRNEMNEQLVSVAARRSAEKARLRAALAGDEEAAAEGDRVAPDAEGDRVPDAEGRPAVPDVTKGKPADRT